MTTLTETQIDILTNGSDSEITSLFTNSNRNTQIAILEWGDPNGSFSDEEQTVGGGQPLTDEELYDIFISLFIEL